MGRRFRRFRRLAQQVVTVTRRLWRVCYCCGAVTANPRQDVVPLAAILSNTKAARLNSGTPQRSSIRVCCHCLACTSSSDESTPYIYNEEHPGSAKQENDNLSREVTDGAKESKTAQHVTETTRSVSDASLNKVKIEQKDIESRQYNEIAQVDKGDSNVRLNPDTSNRDAHVLSARSSSSDLSCCSFYTDDNVALRYYAGSPSRETPTQSEDVHPSPSQTSAVSQNKSQTDNTPALRYMVSQPSQVQQISSQTDDNVPMRYLYPRPSELERISSQIVDFVIMRLYSRPLHVQSRENNYGIPTIVQEGSSQTDDRVPMRYYNRPADVQRISSQTDDMLALRFHDEVSRNFDRPSEMDETALTRCNSVSSGLFAVSSQTDDDVAMRYLSGPVRLFRASSQTDDHVAMRFYNDAFRLPGLTDTATSMYHTVPTNVIRISSQTDDIVALRFLTEPPRAVHPIRRNDDSCNDPIPSISASSQTDDFVAMRYYCEQFRSSSNSSQTDDDVAMRFYSVQDTAQCPSNQPDMQQAGPSIEPSTQQTGPTADLITAGPSQSSYQRDPGQYPWATRGNPVPDTPDSSTSIEVRRRHWNVEEPRLSADDPGSAQVRTQLTLKFPISKLPVPPVTKPKDLTVEFAVVNEWHRIYPVEWTKVQNIARTRTGSVDLTILGEYNKQIAIKTLNAETSVLESQLLIKCQGPFVVQLCACMVQGNERFLCMTYYTRRDLAQWLKKDPKRKYFREKEAVWILAYILCGVDFLHEHGILHLDIKPANILIDNKGYPVVGDFGSAMRMKNLGDFVAFTPAYAAPEILLGLKPTILADMWSVACTFYEILVTRVPYIGKFCMETELRVALGVALEASRTSADSRDYLASELKYAPRDRLSFDGSTTVVMHHAVFKSVHWTEVIDRSRKLECRLFKVFQQIDRDEFNRRNKPDPIPPDSIFYRSWSEYMKDNRPPLTAATLNVNDYRKNPNAARDIEQLEQADNSTSRPGNTSSLSKARQHQGAKSSGKKSVRFLLPEPIDVPVDTLKDKKDISSSSHGSVNGVNVEKDKLESDTVSSHHPSRPKDAASHIPGEEAVTGVADDKIHSCVDQT